MNLKCSMLTSRGQTLKTIYMIFWNKGKTIWVENYINCFKGLEVGGLDYLGAEETGQGSGTLL